MTPTRFEVNQGPAAALMSPQHMLITMAQGQGIAARKAHHSEKMQVAQAIQANEESHNRDLKDLVGAIATLDTGLTNREVAITEGEQIQQHKEDLNSQKEGELLRQLSYTCEVMLKNQRQAQADAMRLAADKIDLCRQVAELKSQHTAAMIQLRGENSSMCQQLADQQAFMEQEIAKISSEKNAANNHAADLQLQVAALNQAVAQKDLTINFKQEQIQTIEEQMVELRSQLQESMQSSDKYFNMLSERDKQLEDIVEHNNLKDRQIRVLEQENLALKSMLEIKNQQSADLLQSKEQQMEEVKRNTESSELYVDECKENFNLKSMLESAYRVIISQTETINTAKVQFENLHKNVNTLANFHFHRMLRSNLFPIRDQCNAIVLVDSCDRIKVENQKLADPALNTLHEFIQSGLTESLWVERKMDELRQMIWMDREAIFTKFNEILAIKPDHFLAKFEKQKIRTGDLNAVRAFIQSGLSESLWVKRKMDELETLYKENKFGALMTKADEILIINPDDASALFFRGLAYYSEGMFYSALSELECSYKLERNYRTAAFTVALNAHLKRIPEATSYYNECLALSPSHKGNKGLLEMIEKAKGIAK
jgi:hypothetical protein